MLQEAEIKKYFYLSGLPRSGNTLLSALLNQHPKIYSSSLSPVLDYAFSVSQNFSDNSADPRYIESEKSKNIIKGILDSYHKNIKKPIVFDRHKFWCTYESVNLIKNFINPRPKIIFTVRDFFEIAESSIKSAPDYIDKIMIETNFISDPGLSINDNRTNYLLGQNGIVSQMQSFLHVSSLPENKDIFHVVKYNDLISNTQNVMDKIYNFFEIEAFTNDLNDIELEEKENDEALGLPKDLHKVYPTIQSNKANTKNFFSDYVLEKYKNLNSLIL
jgi:sulfotransferase